MLRKFKENPETAFKLPRFAQTLSKIEECPYFKFNKYQGIKLTNFAHHKASLPSNSVKIFEGLIETLNQYFDEFRKIKRGNLDQAKVSAAIEKQDDKVMCHLQK